MTDAAAKRVSDEIDALGAVMKWAVAMGYRPDNPAGDALGQALGRQQAVVQHMRALPHGAVADALATVRASQAAVTTKRAFEFLVVTAARSGEVRLATWDGPGRWRVDHPCRAHEGEAGPPRAALWGGRSRSCTTHGDGATAPVWCSAVHAWEAALRHATLSEIDQRTRHRRRAAWVPIELPGLGGGADKHTPRSGRGRARPYGTKPHRGGLRPQ